MARPSKFDPSADSYFHEANALRVIFSGTEISHIAQLSDGTRRATRPKSSRCSSRIFSTARARSGACCDSTICRRLLVHAVLAAEDKRFFEHGALDVIRVFGAALADVRLGRKAQGASTIDMQVARTFFFTTKRDWRRKVKEV